MSARVLVCCGVGGAGKTTSSAAVALAHAESGLRTAVLTIDPARRLADALGIELTNEPRPVPGVAHLHALMLDRKATWDDVVRRFSPNEEHAERLFANRYFQSVATRLTGSHEYMAIEKLHELVHGGQFDLVVVDTPPAQHVLDFFRAPERVRDLLDRGAIQALIQPTGIAGLAARGVMKLVEQIAGEGVMSDVREFFDLIGALSKNFSTHSDQVAALLVSDATQYLLVTEASAPERSDVLGFLQELEDREMAFAGFLVNRTAPELQEALLQPLERPDGMEEADWGPWAEALSQVPLRARERHALHMQGIARLRKAAKAPIWQVPEVPGGIVDLEGLRSLVPHLPPTAPSTP